MAKREINIKRATDIVAMERGEEWIHSVNNYDQVTITLGKECEEWCDGSTDLEIKKRRNSHGGADDGGMYTDGNVM